VAVVGGGIVGTASAMALLEGFRCSLVLLEKEGRLAGHQTGHNSGVIHSGLYYRPGSLKARLCTEGRRDLLDFCRHRDIPHEVCGKVVVAKHPGDVGILASLESRGRENGLTGLRTLSPSELRQIEPHAAGVAALHVPETGIVDFTRVTEAFGDRVRALGGEIRLDAPLLGVARDGERLRLLTGAGEISCRFLVGCGGLQSDRVARLAGLDPGLRIVPFRGEYYELKEDRRFLVKNLIYPAPDPRFPFLGVHFTRRISGVVEAGPNAVLSLKREGYAKTSFSGRDALETATWPGFWKLARQYMRTGLGETWRSWNKRAFVRALKALLPEIEGADLVPAGSGVRAQAVDREGRLLDDFHFVETARQIHVLNAPSPAATASIAIGRFVAEKAGRSFGLRSRP